MHASLYVSRFDFGTLPPERLRRHAAPRIAARYAVTVGDLVRAASIVAGLVALWRVTL